MDFLTRMGAAERASDDSRLVDTSQLCAVSWPDESVLNNFPGRLLHISGRAPLQHLSDGSFGPLQCSSEYMKLSARNMAAVWGPGNRSGAARGALSRCRCADPQCRGGRPRTRYNYPLRRASTLPHPTSCLPSSPKQRQTLTPTRHQIQAPTPDSHWLRSLPGRRTVRPRARLARSLAQDEQLRRDRGRRC